MKDIEILSEDDGVPDVSQAQLRGAAKLVRIKEVDCRNAYLHHA